MRRTQIALLITLIVIPASSFATQIIIGKGSKSYPINSLTFGITSPSGTSPGTSPCVINSVQVPNCDFVNVSGSTWKNLFLAFSPFQPGTTFSCSGSPWYSNCTFEFAPDGEATGVLFFNISPVAHCDPATDNFCGIPSGSPGDFTFTVIGFTAPTDFDGQANAPEPATLALLLLGLASIGWWGYRRRKVAI